MKCLLQYRLHKPQASSARNQNRRRLPVNAKNYLPFLSLPSPLPAWSKLLRALRVRRKPQG